MFLALLLSSSALPALPLRGNEAGPETPILYVQTAEGWAPLRAGPVDREIVPLNSRSERVPCAATTAQGIQVRLWAGNAPIRACDALQVWAVQHGMDERVLSVDGQPWIIGRERLPERARTPSRPDALPWLARHDGEALTGAVLPLITPLPKPDANGESAFAVYGEAPPRLDDSGPVPFLRWTGRTRATRIVLHGPTQRDPIDQVFLAQARAVEGVACHPLRLRRATLGAARLREWSPWRGRGLLWPLVEREGAAAVDSTDVLAAVDDKRLAAPARALVEAWFEAPPPAPADRTWTLLVSVVGSDTWPPPPDAPREDARRRAGLFVDAARDFGLDAVHFEGPDLQLDIRPTMGPGAAWGDVDGDGWVDLFLPQGGGREGSEPPTSRFFRNHKGQEFVDESEKRGLALTGAGMGALFYDADGDGDLDLFVANYGRNRFLLNDGQGKFADASDAVGLDSDLWHAAVSAADFDGDGDLDLYVTAYLKYDTSQLPSDEELGRYQREDPVEMLPFAFPGERKLLLRCDLTAGKDGAPATIRYVDVAKELGVDDPNGRGMQAVWWDFDQDGDQDLYLANDVSPNRFWRNEGGGKFKDVVFSTGLDDPRGSMGLAVGDVDGDGDEDLFVSNWQLESNALYVNNLRHTSARSRVATFRDKSVEAGLGQLSVGVTSWGCELLDFDLDGDLDLFYANGYTSPDYESTGICVGQPCHYFENDGGGRFTPAFERAGPDAAIPFAARAAVACDFDRDGDLDLVVTANNGRVRLLRNTLDQGGRHWLGLRLRARGANTHAIGAFVTLEHGGRKQVRSLRAGTGYLSGNAPELHFGLGTAGGAATCSVRWPSGRESTHAIDAVDRFVTLTEPE